MWGIIRVAPMNTRKYIVGLALVASFLIGTPALAAGLTEAQIQAIVSLLSSFGADSATVSDVNAVLHGQAVVSTTASTTPCLMLNNNLYADITDATTNGEVSKLQQFLGGRVTGYFGPLTLQLVQSWQTTHGVVSSGSPDTTGYGYAGPKTRTAMSCAGNPVSNVNAATPSQSNNPHIQTATTTAATSTPSGTIPATPAVPSSGGGGGGTGATPATPAIPATPVAQSQDTTAPVISNISAATTQTTATITWTTNESADSKVIIATSTPIVVENSTMTTSHSLSFSNLSSGTTYSYSIVSKDSSGNTTTSSVQTFTTVSPPAPPFIDLSSLLPLRPWDVVMSGSDYIVTMVNLDSNIGRLIRVTPSGTISTIASFNKRVFGVALSGSDFIVSDGSTNILRVSNDGSVTTIASGVTTSNFSSDIALSGSDYIVTDYPNARLLKVTPDGVVSVIATGLWHANGVIVDGTDYVVAANALTSTGTGNSTLYRVTQDGNVSVIAELSGGSSITVAKIGSYYYVSDQHNLIRIASDGTTSVANSQSGGQIMNITNNGSNIIGANYQGRLEITTP